MTIQNPRLPELTLDLQKTTVFVARPFRLTQTDQGYIQPFRLTNAWSQYDVSAENLNFAATKPDGNIIDIKNEPTRFRKEGAVWLFTLPVEIAQAVGNVTAYFYITDKSNNILATTTKFGYEIGARYGDDVKSNSYISKIEDMEKRFQDYITNAHNQLNEQNNLTNESRDKLNKFLSDKQTEVTNWISSKTAEVDRDIKSRQDQLNSLNSQYTSKYNELVATWNNRLTAINSEWNSKKTDYDNKAKTQRDSVNSEWNSLKSQFTTDRNNAIKTANDSFTAKLNSIQSDWNAEKSKLETEINQYKSQLEAKVQPVADKVNDLLNTKLPDLNGKADAVQKKIDKLRADFNSIDFSSYATKMDLNNAIAANKPEGTVVTGYDIDSNTKTTAHVKYADKFLVGGEILSTFADAIQRLRGTGTHKITNAVDVNTLTGDATMVSAYICQNSNNTNTPPFFNDNRGTLIVANYDGNAKTQIWIPVGTPAMSGAGFAYRYLQGPIVNDWQKVNAGEIADALTKANNALSRNGGNMTVKSTINWQGINTVEDNQGNLGGLYWGGGSDWLKIYGDNNGNDNLDLAMDLGDDGSNHISFRWNGAEKAGITSNGKFTGNIDWANINGRPMFMPITRGQSNEDVLAFKTNQIRMYVSVSGIKNLPANLSNKTWFSVQYVFESESNDGVAILRTPANEVWINGNNGGSYGVWHRYLNDVDYNTLSSQITELKNKMPDIHTVSTEAEGTTYLQSHPNAIIFVKG